MTIENHKRSPFRSTVNVIKHGVYTAFPTHRRGNVSASDRMPRLKKLAKLMDGAFRIPGTQRRIGLDSLVGLIPGIGDVATTAVSAYIIRDAWLLGMPKRKLAKMAFNVAIDTLLGAVPVVGDIFDFAFKSNSKNVTLIEEHFGFDCKTVEGSVIQPHGQ